MENWSCPAIDHGVSIFPDQKIRPCCQISTEYSKPLESISDPNRFADLKLVSRPDSCKKCWENEDNNRPSYRQVFLKFKDRLRPGINFLDFRHSNQCNLKCRYCNPHFSNQWARELGPCNREGWHTVRVRRSGRYSKDEGATRPHYEIREFRELRDLLERDFELPR